MFTSSVTSMPLMNISLANHKAKLGEKCAWGDAGEGKRTVTYLEIFPLTM